MRIEDLAAQLDWKEASDLRTRYRYTLLAYALPEEIVGDLPDWTPQRQEDARQCLVAEGVWAQVVDILIEKGLMQEKPALGQRIKNWLTSKSN